MAEQLLYGADVVATQQQVGGKRMAQRVRCRRFVDGGGQRRPLERALERLVNLVVATQPRPARINRQRGLRKHPEPHPGQGRAGVLAIQRVGHLHARHARGAVGGPLRVGCRQLGAQRPLKRGGQHHDAVFAALALAHHDGAACEIDVLDPQTQAFQQAHAGAVEQLAEQTVVIRQGGQHLRHLVMRQHHRKPGRALRAVDLLHPRHRQAEHLLVQKQQGRQSLLVGGHRHVSICDQPGQEGLDLGAAQISRMAQAVKAHEGAHPMDVGLFGPYAVVEVANLAAKLIQQPTGRRHRAHGHGQSPVRVVLYANTVSTQIARTASRDMPALHSRQP